MGGIAGRPETGPGGALRREAAAAIGVFLLLLNILAGTLSLAQFDTVRGLAFLEEGKIVLCAGGSMLVLGPDGKVLPGGPGEPQHNQRECICCALMQAGMALPPLPPALQPAELATLQIMRPGTAQHLDATAVPAQRNRGPPAQA